MFDAIAILKKENMEDDDLVNYFSIFMIFGYVNETTINKDLSPILSDNDNYAQNINLVSFLYEDIIIDNNIFGYIPDDKLVLISYPDEISIIKEDDETPIESNTILYKNQNYKVKQNTNLEKTDKYYYIEFQPIIKEPNFADLYNNADDFITYPTDADYNFESEYEPKIFYGKNNKLQFKLCHEYCAKCKEIGVSNNNQKCLTCLPNYQYDYWFYKNINIGNCVPEGYYNDKESGLLGLCNSLPNAKFYLNKTDNKRICFKSEYDCPESYPLFNETKNECYNNFIPTTILTKIPTTIPTKISTRIPTTIPNIIPTTIPIGISTTILKTIPVENESKNKNTIKLNEIQSTNNFEHENPSSEVKSAIEVLTIGNLTKHQLYQSLKNTIINNIYSIKENVIIPTNNSEYIFEVTTIQNQLDIINGEKEGNYSVIDLKECGDILKSHYNLDPSTDLIILKYENNVNDTNDKSIQYEVYAPNITEKLNLSICTETNVNIEIYVPVQLFNQQYYIIKNCKINN